MVRGLRALSNNLECGKFVPVVKLKQIIRAGLTEVKERNLVE